MRKIILVLKLSTLTFLAACQTTANKTIQTSKKMVNDSLNKTDEEWRKILTTEQYNILREKGTESPFTGKFNMHFEKGKYVCAGCGNELFDSESKFESHCGWPSFDNDLGNDRIKRKTDISFGMKRTEIICANCGGHLGHIFDDGPTKTGQRYCVNSLSIDFKPVNDSTLIK